MKRILKWTGITIVSIVAVLLIIIYAGSEYRFARSSTSPRRPSTYPRTPRASIVEGTCSRRGCEGCHGQGLAGQVFFDIADGREARRAERGSRDQGLLEPRARTPPPTWRSTERQRRGRYAIIDVPTISMTPTSQGS